MKKQTKLKKVGTVAVATAVALNATLPWALIQVDAAQQGNSSIGGKASDKLMNAFKEKAGISNLSADQVLAMSLKDTKSLNNTTATITADGNYTVDGAVTLSSLLINANTTIWVKKGATLTIQAAAGDYAGINNYNTGGVGHTALTIQANKKVNFVGEGTINIVGGTGGLGGYWANQSNGSGIHGGIGGVGGYAIDNAGTLTFANTFSGKANISGGVGGAGGHGQKSSDNYLKNAGGYVAGAGGAGGSGGVAIKNSGTVSLETDASKYTLATSSTYANGNVNIKGGMGGNGGAGGAAGDRSVAYTHTPPNYAYGFQSGSNQGQESNGAFTGAVTYVTQSGYPSDHYTTYPNRSGNGGQAGKGGIGITGGNLLLKAGLSTIEGGNTGGKGTIGTIAESSYLSNGVISYSYVIYTAVTTNYVSNGTNHESTGSSSQTTFTQSVISTDPIDVGSTLGNSGDVAMSGVAVNQTGGTFYAFSGNANASDSISGGSVSREGGNFFTGNSSSNGYDGMTNAKAVHLSQLEGYAADTDKDGVEDSKNYYILNAGDTYLDALGEEQTSKGILINGVPYGSKDVFVNPQGYVYLKNVNDTDKISMQVAIGGTRYGNDGTDTKYVTSEAGIYTYSGQGTSLNATFANDDSSMDMDWLAEQMADDFSGSKTENQIEINTAYKLAAFAYAVNHGVDGAANAHVKLSEDIDLKAMYWTPIGNEEHPFIGVFDGNNKKIKNMRIQAIDDVNTYGLFGNVKGLQNDKNITAMLHDFTLTNGEYVTNAEAKTVKYNGSGQVATSGGNYSEIATYVIEKNDNSDIYAGAIAGYSENATFSNINVENMPMSVTTNGDAHLGGLVGYDGILEDAQAQSIENVKVANSSLTAKGNTTYVGGIVGEAIDIDINNVHSVIDTTGTNAASGKQTTSDISATSSKNESYVGGIVAKASTTLSGSYRSITNSDFSDASTVRTITSNGNETTYAGGIGGSLQDMEVRNVKAYIKKISADSTSSTAYTGGIVGKSDIKETKYRAIHTSEVKFGDKADNISATGKTDSYLGGIAGYANHTDSYAATISNMAPSSVVAEMGKAYVAGNVGYANTSIINTASIAISNDVNSEASHGAWSSGALGYGVNTSVTNQNVTLANVKALSNTYTAAYAGGIVGQMENDAENAADVDAILSNNNVTFTANNQSITAQSKGIKEPAYAGGIVGDAVNASVYGNNINNTTVRTSLSVNAFSTDGSSYAGGMAGRLNNALTAQNITIADTTINNISVNATGADTTTRSGGESYAGGMAGQAIADNVNVTNAIVKGTSNVKAMATYDVYAGRLFGHTDRMTMINSSPSASSSVTADTIGGDAYAAGLIGKLDDLVGKDKEKVFQSTISVTNVAKTNVTANAGVKFTSYAGSLLGDAKNVKLEKSSVNQGITSATTLSTVTVKGKDAYVGGIGGRIQNASGKQIPYYSVSAIGVKTDSKAVNGNVKQAGLYGEINDVMIASSFAKDYLNTHDTADASDLHGGLFGEAKNIRMIQSYGTSGNTSQTGIATNINEPGLAAKLTGTNTFYGVYSTQTQWAKDGNGKAITATDQGKGNIFKACYYQGNSKPVTTGSAWGSSIKWGAENYAKNGDLYALKNKENGTRYYDSLSATNLANSSTRNNVSNAMRNLLHFTANTVDEQELKDFANQDITTEYEKEVNYKLTYANGANNLQGNFTYPTFTEPYFLTMALNPGEEYGNVASNSSIATPGSKKFSANSDLQFTAVPKDVPEESSFWYEFGNWTVQKRTFDSNGNTVLSEVTPAGLSKNNATVNFKMPEYDTIITANFVQKDNAIRRNINQEIYEKMMAEVTRRSKLSPDAKDYIDGNNISEEQLKEVLVTAGTSVLHRYVGNTGDTYRNNMVNVYDKINADPIYAYTNYDSLKDKDRVLQQIADKMSEEAFNSDPYKFNKEDGKLSLDELSDVRVDVNDTFTSKGVFKDFVTAQQLAEATDVLKPVVVDTNTDDKGNLIANVEALFTGENTTLEYSFSDPKEKDMEWIETDTINDSPVVPLDEDTLKNAEYIYLRNVNELDYEVITRVALSQITTNVENIKVNSDTTNMDVGVAGKLSDGKTQSITTGQAELLKSSKEIEIAGGVSDAGDWYYGLQTSGNEQTIINAQPKPGAYLDSFTLEVNGKTYTIDDDTVLSGGNVTFDDVTFHVSGERFSANRYDRAGLLSFPSAANVTVTSNYVNLLGEINASVDLDTSEDQYKQIANIINEDKFTKVFQDAAKNEPKDVTNAKKRYDSLTAQEKQLVQEKIIQFLPKDADKENVGYTRAEFIDIFNAITNIVFCDSKLGIDESGKITNIKEEDFTSGTWKNLSDAQNNAALNLNGNFIQDDGNAKSEAKKLLEAANALEDAIRGLNYKVQSFTLSTNKEDWIDVAVVNKGNGGDLLATAALLEEVNSDIYKNIVKFPYQHSDVTVTINEAQMQKDGFAMEIVDSKNNVIIAKDGTIGEDAKNITSEVKDGKRIYTFADISESVVYKASFAKKVYKIAIPKDEDKKGIASISNANEKDEQGNLKNLEGTTVSVEDMSTSAEENYILHVALDDGYHYKSTATADEDKVSYVYKDTGGKEQTAYVVIDNKGNINIPKEHLSSIKDLNISNAIGALEKDNLSEEITRIEEANYDEKDYTPETYVALNKAKDAASTVVDNGSASEAEINEAYQNLQKAEQGLIRQYEINLSGSNLTVPKMENVNVPVTQPDTNAKYLQNGVVELDGKFYAQEGYGVFVQPEENTLATMKIEDKVLDEVSYKESGKDKEATLRSDGFTAYIPTIMAPITNLKATSKANTINIVEGTMQNQAGEDVEVNGEVATQEKTVSVVTQHVPDIKVSDISDTPIKLTADIKGNNLDGKESVGEVSITLPTEDVTSPSITYTGIDGKETSITLTADQLKKITVTTNDEKSEIEVPGEILDAILAEVSKKTPSLTLKGEYQIGDVNVTTKDQENIETTTPATDEGSPKKEVSGGEDTTTDVSKHTPAYLITPEIPYVTAEVIVDGVSIVSPNEEMLAKIKTDGAKTEDGANAVYIYKDKETDTTYVLTCDKEDTKNNKEVVVKPSSQDYEVKFNLDTQDTTAGSSANDHLKDTKYGEAAIIWNQPDTQSHMVDANFAKKQFNVTTTTDADTQSMGQVVSDKDIVSYGDTASFTLTPTSGNTIELTSKITLQHNGKDISASLIDLKKNEDVAVEIKYDAKGAVSSAKITVKNNENSLGIITDESIFRSNAVADIVANQVQPAVDHLKDVLDIVAAIEEQKENGPYVYGDHEYDVMKEEAAGGDTLLDKLTNDDGSVLDTIKNAKNENEILTIIEGILGEQVISSVDAQNKIDDVTKKIEDAIKNLNAKDEDHRLDQLVITLPMNAALGADVALDKEQKPSVDVVFNADGNPAKKGSIVTDGTQNLTIQPLFVNAGNDLQEITMKIKDPESGKTTDVTISLTQKEGAAGKSEISWKDADGMTQKVEITQPSIQKAGDASSVTLNGSTLKDIFQAVYEPDVIAGIVEEITVSKTQQRDEMNPNKDNATVDEGIDISEKQVKVQTNTTGGDGATTDANPDADNKISAESEGITLSDIKLKEDYALKGMNVTLKDEDGVLHDIFIPSYEGENGNTTHKVSDDTWTMQVPSDALKDAIKDQTSFDDDEAIGKLKVVDVHASTYAPFQGEEVEVLAGHKITDTILKTSDADGNIILISVPQTDDGSVTSVKVSVYDKDMGSHQDKEVAINASAGAVSTLSNPEDNTKQHVEIKGDLIKDILQTIQKDTSEPSTSALHLEEAVKAQDTTVVRYGNSLPDTVKAGLGILTKLSKEQVLSAKDDKGTPNQILEGEESLLIDAIKPSNGYVFNEVKVELSGKTTEGSDVKKAIVLQIDETGKLEASVDGKNITLADGLIDVTMPTSSKAGSVEIKKDALNALFEACDIAHTGDGKTAIYDGDVHAIEVNAVMQDNKAILAPNHIDEGNSNNLQNPNDVHVDIVADIVLPDLILSGEHLSPKVDVEASDVNGTEVTIKIDTSTSDTVVVVTTPTDDTIQIALPEELAKDIVKDADGNIVEIPGEVLQKILEEYNTTAKKDVSAEGSDKTTTTPLEFPYIEVNEIKDDGGNTISNEQKGGDFVDGALIGNENIVISPVQVDKGHALENTVITTKDDQGNTITMVLPITPNPDVANKSVEVIVKTADGKEEVYEIPTDRLEDIIVSGLGDKKISVPGDMVKDIIAKTVEESKEKNPDLTLDENAGIDSIVVNAVRVGPHVHDEAKIEGEGILQDTPAPVEVINRKDHKVSDEPILLPKQNDVYIQDVKVKEGYKPDIVTVTLKDDTKEYKVELPIDIANAKEIKVTSSDGTETTLPLLDSEYPEAGGIDLSGITISKESPYDICLPGDGLQEIMNTLSGNEDPQKPADMDITEINVHVAGNTWILPLAEQAVTNSNAHSAQNVKEINSIVFANKDDEETSKLTTDKALVVAKDGTFTMQVDFGEDDYATVNPNSHNFLHTYNGLSINGIHLSKSKLSGIVKVQEDGTLVIDTKKLSNKVAEVSGEEFNGYTSIEVIAIPQNPQYKTFINEYMGLDSMNQTSTEYEALVKKLLAQFDEKTGEALNPDILTPDNKIHLLDYKADLLDRLNTIELTKKAQDLAQKIKDLYAVVDPSVNAVDGDKNGLPFDYKAEETINAETIGAIEDYRGQILELEKEYNALNKKGQTIVNGLTKADEVADDGIAEMLKQMQKAIDAVDNQTISKSSQAAKLLDELLNKKDSLADIVDDAQHTDHPTSPVDTYSAAKSKLQSINEMKQDADKVERLLKALTADELKTISGDQQKALKALQKTINEEYVDFANLFVKEYLTTDKAVYQPGSDVNTSSALSTNGYSQTTYKSDPITTKEGVMQAKSEFAKLSDAAQEAIGIDSVNTPGVFHNPTLEELFNMVIDASSAVKILQEQLDDVYNNLSDQATSQKEKDDLTGIYNTASDELKKGAASKDSAYEGNTLDSILTPNEKGLQDVDLKNMDRRATSLDTTISYQEDGKTKQMHVKVDFDDSGKISAVTKSVDNVTTNVVLTPEQKNAIKVTLPTMDKKGDLLIPGSVLEGIAQLPSGASDAKITKVDVSEAPLSTDKLSQIVNKGIKDMNDVSKEAAKQDLTNADVELKQQIDGILPDSIKDVLDNLMNAGHSMIDDGEATQAHSTANEQIEAMKDAIITSIKNQLAKEYADNAENTSDEGKEALDELYKKALKDLNNVSGSDRVEQALDILAKTKAEMKKIVSEHPKEDTPDKPTDPTDPEDPENPEDPNKPPYNPINPINPSTPQTSIPGSSLPQFEVSFGTDTMLVTKKDTSASDAEKQLKKTYDRIHKDTKQYANLKGYDALYDELDKVYQEALKKLKTADAKDRADIVAQYEKEMKEIEARMKNLKSSKQSTGTSSKEKDTKSTDAAIFNIFSLVAMLGVVIFGFIKRHRLTAIALLDLVVGGAMLLLTQGLNLANMQFMNAYSIWFAGLFILDVVVLVFMNKKHDDSNDSKS